MTSTANLNNQVTSTSTSTASAVTTNKLPQLLCSLPAELHILILPHFSLTTLLYLATRSLYFRGLITSSILTALPPDSNPLTIMASSDSPFWPEYKNVNFRKGMGRFNPPDMRAVLRFLGSSKGCITLRAFRTRLCLIEQGSQTLFAPSEVICYNCLVTKPLEEFRKEQTEGSMVMGGNAAIKRRCLACEQASGWKEDVKEEPGAGSTEADSAEKGQKSIESKQEVRRGLLTAQPMPYRPRRVPARRPCHNPS